MSKEKETSESKKTTTKKTTTKKKNTTNTTSKKDAVNKTNTKAKTKDIKKNIEEKKSKKEEVIKEENIEEVIDNDFDYDEDLEDGYGDDFEEEEIVEVKKESKEKETPKKDVSKDNIKKIEKMAKEKKKTRINNGSKVKDFGYFLEMHRHVISSFIAGALITTLVAFIIWPERIATLKNGTQPVVTVDGKTYTANDLYDQMKAHYSVSQLLDEIDNDLLTELYPEDDEMNEEVEATAENVQSGTSAEYTWKNAPEGTTGWYAEITDENGGVLAKIFFQKPVLQDGAYSAINQSIQKACEDFLGQKAAIQKQLEKNPEMGTVESPYLYTSETTITRRERGIFSVRLDQTETTENGNIQTVRGMTFDLETGKQLRLTDLFSMEEKELTAKLSDTLEDTGYSVAAAPVHISDRVYIGVLTALFILCVAVGCGFSSSYPMTWESTPAGIAAESEADSVRSELTDTGFPDFVARDMADEDVLKLESSAKVFTDSRERAVDGGKLEITTVVSMNSEDALDFSVIHYFKWTDNPDHLYSEGIKIYPAYADPGFDAKGEVSGRVLCEKGGETLASGYRSLGEEILTGTDFWGEYRDTVIIGTYSIPDGSKNCRGYVMYSAESPDGSLYGGYKSGFFFAHQNSLLIYPHETAEDELTSSDLSEYSCFDTDSIFTTGSMNSMEMGS